MTVNKTGPGWLKTTLAITLVTQTMPAVAHTVTEISTSALLHNLAHTQIFLSIMVIFTVLLLSTGTIIRIATSGNSSKKYLAAGGIGLVLSGITLMLSV